MVRYPLFTPVSAIGFFLLFCTFFLALSLFSFNIYDPSPLCLVAHTTPVICTNLCGTWGAWCSAYVFSLFGLGAFLLIPFLLSASLFLIHHTNKKYLLDTIYGLALIITGSTMLTHDISPAPYISCEAGGRLGETLFRLCETTTDTYIAHCTGYITMTIGLILISQFFGISAHISTIKSFTKNIFSSRASRKRSQTSA